MAEERNSFEYLHDFKDFAHAVRGCIARAEMALSFHEGSEGEQTDRTKKIGALLGKAHALAQEL